MKNILYPVVLVVIALTAAGSNAPRGVMLMNRIGPSVMELFVANADGTGERQLFTDSDFDYNASWSADGQWIIFTSERTGYGQADLYRVHPDGSGLERLTDNPAVDDQGCFSPDGKQVAFVSTREEPHKANIWVLDVLTKRARKLTGGADLQVTNGKPDGFFRPSWSPDGQWIAFSSDRLTEWHGHEAGAGAGHKQITSIYIIHPDGTGVKRLTDGHLSAGSPQWSRDSKRVVFYEFAEADIQGGPGGGNGGGISQIASVDIATSERIQHTSGPGLKMKPQFLDGNRIGYLVKAAAANSGVATGLAYSDGTKVTPTVGRVRSPSWSPDGKQVVYEKTDFTPRPQGQRLYSWDPDYEYHYTDVFPVYSKNGTLVTTDLQRSETGNNPHVSISTWNTDGYTGRKRIFSNWSGSAMMANWSPDGKQLVFGFGTFFGGRNQRPAQIMMMDADGSNVKALTDGLPNAGFPSWSPDGKSIVYRVWNLTNKNEWGLRLMNLADHSIKVLSTEWDNFPFFSPSGDRILFTRQKASDKDFDIFTMKPDGTDVKQLTTAPGTDGHATWSADGKHIFFMSTRVGFKDEILTYDFSPQPYAQIFIMNADGTHVRQLTESRWEDSMPIYVPQGVASR